MDPELQAILARAGLVTPQQQQAYLMSLMSGVGNPFMAGAGGDLGDANRGVDYMRDYNTMLADPMTMAAAGLPGVPGMVGWAVDQFQPVREYVDRPGRQRYEAAIGSGPTTPDGWIASQIEQGNSPAMVQGYLDNLLRQDPATLDEDNAAVYQMFSTVVPQYTTADYETGEPRQVFDLSEWVNTAKDFQELSGMANDPNVKPDGYGRWYIETPSEMAQTYDERGLPYPTLQYELADFSPEAADAQTRAAYLRSLVQERDSSGYYDRLDEDLADARRVQAKYQETGGPYTEFGDVLRSARDAVDLPYPMRTPGRGPVEAAAPTEQEREQERPGGVWRIFGDEAPRVKGALSGIDDPFRSAGKSVANTLLRHESPWWDWGDEESTDGTGAGLAGELPTGFSRLGTPLSSGAVVSRDKRNREAMERAADKVVSTARKRNENNKRSDEWRARTAEKEALGYRTWEMQPNGKFGYTPNSNAQARTDFALARATGRTPLSDELQRRAQAMYMLGFGG